MTVLAAVVALWTVGGSHEARAETKAEHIARQVEASIALFKKTDPKMEKLFKSAAGYAVFTSVGKGAFGIGAAYGEGEVFVSNMVLPGSKKIGRASLTQVTIGLQLGGQAYDEVIFFETKEALEDFKAGKLALSAQVSAVAAAEGASANAKYQQGVMVFTMAKGGLMYEASVGGQKFKFFPLKK
jgi:lipid-binding SYLF domain-containing protein